MLYLLFLNPENDYQTMDQTIFREVSNDIEKAYRDLKIHMNK